MALSLSSKKCVEVGDVFCTWCYGGNVCYTENYNAQDDEWEEDQNRYMQKDIWENRCK